MSSFLCEVSPFDTFECLFSFFFSFTNSRSKHSLNELVAIFGSDSCGIEWTLSRY